MPVRSHGDLTMSLRPMFLVPLVSLLLLLPSGRSFSQYPPGPDSIRGSYYTGRYANFFSELLGLDESDVTKKIDQTFRQLFYGDDKNQRIYYPVDTDMAYIEDINNRDVRTEGMSYGMMIAVQLDKREEFDRIWKWAKTFMQFPSGPRKNYFAWHCAPTGEHLDSSSASDGEEWFVMALLFASARWGNGEGIYNYRSEANSILHAMLHQEESPANNGMIRNMFSRQEKQVVFVPSTDGARFTDPSYHLPHFYELWARWAAEDNDFWCEAARTSRQFLKKATNPSTGLAPDYAQFDGSPFDRWGGTDDFRFDAWRVAMNVAVDYQWFARDPWEVEQSNRLLRFFGGQGHYGNQYTLAGRQLSDDHSAGLVAMNAVAGLAATDDQKKFVQEFWDTPIPSGPYRYYDGMLYMLGLLQVSGNFRIYHPAGRPVEACESR